jgi:hypothetical protein
MTFEDSIGQLNAAFFFREFSFSSNTFKPDPSAQVELADQVVWLDELLIAAQIKERNAPLRTTADKEKRWFTDEVVKKATRQMKDTLSYLNKYTNIQLANRRGHVFNLATAKVSTLHKLVIYNAHTMLPEECALQKFHRSRTAGILHLVSVADYLGILNTLVTPVEIGEYLCFRERLIERWESNVARVSEKALVGQYLMNRPEERPHSRFVAYVDALEQRQRDWDIAPLINLFLDRKTTNNPMAADYRVIKELAKLYRTDMAEFRKRWQFSMGKALADEFCQPHRFTASTGCGFVFVPLRREDLPNRRNALLNFTLLNKYDQRLDKCVGLSFIAEGKGSWCDVQWHLREFPWKQDAEVQLLLDKNYPLRPTKERRVERYGLLNAMEGKTESAHD